jgi:S-ribosylhomocysteine lyase LuxS involved in autoinducer biosynthesis
MYQRQRRILGMSHFTIEQFATSAAKNHELLTGGTLSVDKIYRMEEGHPVILSTFFLEVTASLDQAEVHRGMHSLEHALAYSEQTGSIRALLQQMSNGAVDGKQLLDCSPYIHAGVLGFRLTTLEAVDKAVLQEAVSQGLSQASDYLTANPPPFSTARECGQYNFHSAATAVALIQEALSRGPRITALESLKGSGATQRFYVADLRLVKPRPIGDDEHRTLSPLGSHRLSQHVETALRRAGYLTVLGTFGCMTGMYLLVGADGNDPPEAYMRHIHQVIAGELLKLVADRAAEPEVISAAQLAIAYIEKYAPGVYASARESPLNAAAEVGENGMI